MVKPAPLAFEGAGDSEAGENDEAGGAPNLPNNGDEASAEDLPQQLVEGQDNEEDDVEGGVEGDNNVLAPNNNGMEGEAGPWTTRKTTAPATT